jgi:hypothetical protein
LNENNKIINEKVNNDSKPENETNIEPKINEEDTNVIAKEIQDTKKGSANENNTDTDIDKEIKDEQNTKKEGEDKSDINNNVNILNKNEKIE